MEDKTILITGATSGIGKAAALNFAKRGAKIIMVGRDRDRAESARYEILRFSDNNDIHLFFADLSILEETKNFALSVKNVFPKVDVLINNAGTFGTKNKTITKENIEETIATNYLSPVILTLELLDLLKVNSGSQIINVSSIMHRFIKIDWNNLNSSNKYNAIYAYGLSKLLLNTFTFFLADKISPSETCINCVNPGVVYTDISRNYPQFFKNMYFLGEPFMNTPQKGAESIIRLARENHTFKFHGAYIKGFKRIKASKFCYDKTNQEKTWQSTLSFINCKDPFDK